MTYGYSQLTVAANKRASRRLLGVTLGRTCIARGVPVSEVARQFGVSRQTIYNWFGGKHEPKSDLIEAVKSFIASLAK
mgnify:CR=1 FL=1